ncbi:hypothetical protein [Gluconobacter frateurii]|uniref:Uncharacterized protein n=1 Tax=Gluconobacter frateurii NRIC 0228 TaxID=1307946 RepID=A0ABQ0QDC5_9PROT|nr:hypothetical protein [Gluconobacter frateurii]GBR14153.1 hypothetical protein AA0228_2188 [Gluconobacter frateurii NRIC 0228]GLP92018.1 hypothetical protein GCM10007868_30930 [Gluconobacter frateurii]
MTDTLDIKTAYPNRYYASYDTTATQPTTVTGWYDVWDMSDTSNVPAVSDMIPVTAEQWNDVSFHIGYGKGVKDGQIIDYVPPVPLTVQASYALDAARTFVQNDFILLGETPSQEWIDYQKALIAVVNGTSTTLPTAPQA